MLDFYQTRAKTRLQGVLDWLQSHEAGIIQYAPVISAYTVLIIVAYLCARTAHSPQTPLLQFGMRVFDAGLFFGALATAVILVSQTHWVKTLKYLIAVVALAQVLEWMIGAVGDALYAFTRQHPALSVMTVVMLAITALVCSIASALAKDPRQALHAQAVVIAEGRALSARDRTITAFHEAGHTLLFAALQQPAPLLEAWVNRHMTDDGILGSTRSRKTHLLVDDTTAQWSMLLQLAGRMAEQQVGEADFLGSVSDEEQWLREARIFLGAQTRGFYYICPENEQEGRHNTQLVSGLRERQTLMLKQFFSVNEAVLRDLATAMLESPRLKTKAITPYLDRVILPDGFPRPKEL